ncbi:MAG: hypothetical protein P4L71_13965, partial [Acetobacteraceae bacterium]|nr:hypothetical protein [Acetobacteraceae bacterium]
TAAAMATAALVPLGIFPFLNILGFNASVLWICLGYPLAVEIHATNLTRARASRPVRPSALPPLARPPLRSASR